MRRSNVTRIAIVVVAMVFLLAATGCSAPSFAGGLTLFGSEPSSLDPALCADSTSAGYIVEIFSGLVTLDGDLELQGDIAESWEVSPDGLTYTFHLRDGVMFHDGRQVTADDLKYSLERAADPQTASPVAEAYLGDIVGFSEKLNAEADEVSGVRVVDERTLEITIDAPKSYFLAKLTHPTAFVVDRDDAESGEEWWRSPNGTGPFKLDIWEEGQSIVLKRNEGFYRGVAKLDSVTYILRGSSMMMYENGEVDIIGVGTSNIDRVLDPANSLNQELVVVTELSVYYIGFNSNVPPFDDVKVRQAFCHAVDKDKIIEILLKDLILPAAGVIPPGMPGHDEGLQGLGYDVGRARQLLNESSYSDGLPPVVFSAAGSGGGVSSLAVAIAGMWQDNLGVEVSIEALEWDTFYEDVRNRGATVFIMGWIADYPDPENFLDLLFHSESVENHTGYSNPDVDGLLEEARVTSDTDARLELYRQAEDIIVAEAAWLPLWFGQSYYLVKPEVKGFVPAPMVIPVLKDIWIEG